MTATVCVCVFRERLLMVMADRMAADGFVAAGYQYVTVDDCWLANTRDDQGRLQPDPTRFPRGMKHLADYVRRYRIITCISTCGARGQISKSTPPSPRLTGCSSTLTDQRVRAEPGRQTHFCVTHSPKSANVLSLGKTVKFSHTRFRALDPELIPVYRQSARR